MDYGNTMKYFRRPQTAFVNDDELSQKPQSQWQLVGDEGEDSSGKEGQQQQQEHENGNNSNSNSNSKRGDNNYNNYNDDSNDDDNGDEVEKLTQSLETSLEVSAEVKHHPESVLLCGYFREELHTKEQMLTLSTYLPGVSVQELRVYYGHHGVLKIAGARALYHCVQRFERSFALDERLLDVSQLKAILHSSGMLFISVPLHHTPAPPVHIPVTEASPMLIFRRAATKMCFVVKDVDLPGVALKELTVQYSNGVIRLIWERMEAVVPHTKADEASQSSGSGSSNSAAKWQQRRYQRDIFINALHIDTTKLKGYLDGHSKSTPVLAIMAPYMPSQKTNMMPIQVQTMTMTKQDSGIQQDGNNNDVGTNGDSNKQQKSDSTFSDGGNFEKHQLDVNYD